MFLIPGHSGCKIEVIKATPSFLVRKSTDSVNYIPRLVKQCQKQVEYLGYFNKDHISVPRVVGSQISSSGYSFDMHFIFGMDMITYLEHASKNDIDNLLIKITAMIENLVSDSSNSNVTQLIHSKYFTVKNNVRPRWSLTAKEEGALDKIILQHEIVVPIGKCHGDLTFSNILIGRDDKKIHLIDFLDSFIETPLQDMVKIRQDTALGWSLLLYKGSIDAVRIRTVFSYMDNFFVERFMKFDFYRKNYRMLQVINILRVMKYTFNDSIFVYLENCLRSHLDDKI